MKMDYFLLGVSITIGLFGCQSESEVDRDKTELASPPMPSEPVVRSPVPSLLKGKPAPARTKGPETAAPITVPDAVEPLAIPWDSVTKILLEKEGFFDPRAYVFLPDGQTVAGGHDQISFWNAATGQKKQVLPRPRDVPKSSGPHSVMVWLACSADGKRLVTARQNPIGSTMDPNPLVTVWSLPNGREQHSFELTGPLFNLDYPPALSPDGKLLVHVCKERNEKGHGIFGELCVRNLDSREMQWTLPDSGVKAVAISPDGSLLAGYDRKTIRLWELQTGEVVRAIQSERLQIEKLAFARDGGMLAGATLSFVHPKNQLVFWDVQLASELVRSRFQGPIVSRLQTFHRIKIAWDSCWTERSISGTSNAKHCSAASSWIARRASTILHFHRT
jgi:WD40 repeat protein